MELFLVAAIAVIIVGISKGGFGGGLGMLALPIVALVEAPTVAAGILLPVLCFMDLVGLWFYRDKANRQLLLFLLPAAVVGVILGGIGFRFVDQNAIKLLVGVIAASFALYHWFANWLLSQQFNSTKPSKLKGFFWGGISGFTSCIAHAGGPPLGIYLLPLKLDKTIFQGTSVIFFIVVNYVKLIPYSLLGLISVNNLELSLALLPIAFGGMLLGIYLHKRVSADLFYKFCYIALFIIGIKLISDSVA